MKLGLGKIKDALVITSYSIHYTKLYDGFSKPRRIAESRQGGRFGGESVLPFPDSHDPRVKSRATRKPWGFRHRFIPVETGEPRRAANPARKTQRVITSYSIHYTKLYEAIRQLSALATARANCGALAFQVSARTRSAGSSAIRWRRAPGIDRITSYNVCYTKLLRSGPGWWQDCG